jgi:hypothetical protein
LRRHWSWDGDYLSSSATDRCTRRQTHTNAQQRRRKEEKGKMLKQSRRTTMSRRWTTWPC